MGAIRGLTTWLVRTLAGLVGMTLLLGAVLVAAYPASDPSSEEQPPSRQAEAATMAGAVTQDHAYLDAPTPEAYVRTVVIDPGHGADEIGAAANGVVEKDSNLELALRVERLLSANGVRVVLTRRTDARANVGPPVTGYSATRLDLQARIDLANAEAADLFVSIHSNGSADVTQRGIETYYNAVRPFAGLNHTLATLLHVRTLEALGAAGFAVVDRGVKDDSCLRMFQGRCFPLFLLAPSRETTREEVLRRGGDLEALGFAPGQDSVVSRPTEMPGALIELLFVSNTVDAAILQDGAAREAMAWGVARAILDYFARAESSSGGR
jgi:N-acetylmuramoyl-L-alanine amidase